jgi:hypothetical protein
MWEVIFLFIKSIGRSLPLWARVLITFAFILTLVLNLTQPKVPITRPFDVQHERKIEDSRLPTPFSTDQNRHSGDSHKPIENLNHQHATEDRPKNDANLSKFSSGLEKRIDPSTAKRMTDRIYEGLKLEQMGEMELRKSIEEELGPSATREEIDAVKKAIVEQLSEMSSLPHPMPSPQS